MRLTHLPRQARASSIWTPPLFLCPALSASSAAARPSRTDALLWSRNTSSRSAPAPAVPSSRASSQKASYTTFTGQQRSASRPRVRHPTQHHHHHQLQQRRSIYVESGKDAARFNRDTAEPHASGLPLTCPGCGAYTQTTEPEKTGFYALKRRSVKTYLQASGLQQKEDGEVGDILEDEIIEISEHHKRRRKAEDEAFEASMRQLDAETRQELGLEPQHEHEKDKQEGDENRDEDDTAGDRAQQAVQAPVLQPPICDRCHGILNHHRGESIYHPSIDAIQDVVAASPHRLNHIYHVVDAADLPMSLIPNIHSLLDVYVRGRNRRSDSSNRGDKPTLSIIITRIDLLAHNKVSVDKIKNQLVQIIHDALNKRVKNSSILVRAVSSMRGWWTRPIRQELAERAGASWMVGKANVGKSKLIDAVFPATGSKLAPRADSSPSTQALAHPDELDAPEDGSLILPPAAPEVSYPRMPTISQLPGTTAQPIRMRYGNGRGELIDLPGLDRRDLTTFVQQDQQHKLVMQQRVPANRVAVKPGQSFMVGDLVRITPRWADWDELVPADGWSKLNKSPTVLLAAAFVPFDCHRTATWKAVDVQTGERFPNNYIERLLDRDMAPRIASAGTFTLSHDVTRHNTGSLTRKDAAGLDPGKLPFVVCGMDLVIEGVGWVELTCEIRRRVLEKYGVTDPADLPPEAMPTVEVFSPDGKHVMKRRPLNLFAISGKKGLPKSQRTTRPRRSMKGVDKTQKKLRREAEGRQRETYRPTAE